MSAEKLLECIGGIDDRYVEEATPGVRPARVHRWVRWALTGVAAALALVVGVRAAAWVSWNLCDCAPPEEDPRTAETASTDSVDEVPPLLEETIGDLPGQIIWQGETYVARGHIVRELPEGAELLGEVHQEGDVGGPVPLDAPDLTSNLGEGYAYVLPGNDGLIIFRYKEWNEEELGREEPILLLFRELGWNYATLSGAPCYSGLLAMVNAAEVIVEVTATGVEEDMELDRIPDGGRAMAHLQEEPGTARYDVYTVQVTEALKGDVAVGEVLRVRDWVYNDALTTSEEGSYLLFLYDYRAEVSDAPFVLLSSRQGAYPIERRFLYVPVGDPCGLMVSPEIVNPPYTHYSYPMNGIRRSIRDIVEAPVPAVSGTGPLS